ncbi:MAG TPA: hypothetical protein VG736_04835 [Vicinamibacterales bacterium]|jgi:hypothetical protein|nr:hypothetical protein [Vicinamibacterales bacterium]
MTFRSLLHPTRRDLPLPAEAPPCFADLRLDQIVDAATTHDPDVARVFHAPLHDLDAIDYRQAIMRDLEEPRLRGPIETFVEAIRAVRRDLERAAHSSYRYEGARWSLRAAVSYVDAVEQLAQHLSAFRPASRGLTAFAAFLAAYRQADPFRTLAADARRVTAALDAIRYELLIDGLTVTVRPASGAEDYSTVIDTTFDRFSREASHDYRVRFPASDGLNHVGAQIVERVATLSPEPFADLERFAADHGGFVDPIVDQFVRDVRFYLAYLSYLAPLRAAGLPFCYPVVSASKAIDVRDTFDLALARALVDRRQTVVLNDVHLEGVERIAVVSGPNQGGKTTFARTIGQIHYLTALGCPVPGRSARVFLCDQVLTHFEREETVVSLRGKLQDDLTRVKAMLERATPDSLLIFNEIFSSTTVHDAIFLSRHVFERLSALDALGVCVTFLYELATFNEKTVSVVSTIDPADPTIRTFRVERRPADGLAYAMALAEKHHVTYDWLERRLTHERSSAASRS